MDDLVANRLIRADGDRSVLTPSSFSLIRAFFGFRAFLLCPRSILEKPDEWIDGAIVYAFPSELYVAGSLSAGQPSRLYDGTSLLEMRFDRLLATRQLALRADRVVSAGRGLYAAACVTRAWRLVLGFERVEPPRAGA